MMKNNLTFNLRGIQIRKYLTCICLSMILLSATAQHDASKNPVDKTDLSFSPGSNSTSVNPDTRLIVTFRQPALLGTSGRIMIFDASDDSLVDVLDMSIPPGPKNTRTPAPYDTLTWEIEEKFLADNPPRFAPLPLDDIYQHTYIGGKLESDVYHFYPVLIRGNTAVICPHHNSLKYNKTYYVRIDSGVFNFPGNMAFSIEGKDQWTFSTKESGPSLDNELFIVTTDGTGDFNTVQGALDYMPAENPDKKTIFIKNGTYEEIVYFRDKNNITLLGEDREKTIICYANNGIFNARPTGDRAEMIRRFRNRRAVFSAHNCNDICLANFSTVSLGEMPAQAEALLVIGDRIIVDNVTIDGSGDALQATGNIYLNRCSVKGFGDNVLGYGAVFFNECDMISTYGPHLWVRNTNENHGNVFVNSTFSTIGDVETVFARAPGSASYSFPYVEAVLLDSRIEGIRPEGWGQVGEKTDDIRYWEYNSTRMDNGEPADISGRAPYSRQLTMEQDSAIIAFYRVPSNILDGWVPVAKPVIIPKATELELIKGDDLLVDPVIFAIPDPEFQWYKDGKKINGQNSTMLSITGLKKKHAGSYILEATGPFGKVKSQSIKITVK